MTETKEDAQTWVKVLHDRFAYGPGDTVGESIREHLPMAMASTYTLGDVERA